ncbi:MAG: hypothetical protein ACI9EF_004017 [Pseudohongiellaceae bacterium]|jgi:hypothetical protein
MDRLTGPWNQPHYESDTGAASCGDRGGILLTERAVSRGMQLLSIRL